MGVDNLFVVIPRPFTSSIYERLPILHCTNPTVTQCVRCGGGARRGYGCYAVCRYVSNFCGGGMRLRLLLVLTVSDIVCDFCIAVLLYGGTPIFSWGRCLYEEGWTVRMCNSCRRGEVGPYARPIRKAKG